MKLQSYSIFSIIVVLLIGCNTNRRKEVSAIQKDIERIQEWSFEVPDNFLQSYTGGFYYASTFSKDGKDYLLGYNNFLHTIDILDLTGKRAFKQISLQREGNHGVPPGIFGLVYYKDDIVISTQTQYIKINQSGEVISRIQKGDIEKSIINNNYAKWKPGVNTFWMMFSFFFFDSQTGEIAVPFYDYSINPKSPVKVGIFSSDHSIKTDSLDIYYPPLIEKEGNMGLLNSVNICLHANKIIYNFPASSNIYIYDRSTGETLEKDVPSGMMENFFVLPEKDDPEGSLQTGFYFPLQYDPIRNCYWRIQMGNKTKSSKWWTERPYSISRISIDYENEGEYEIPNDLELYCNSLFTQQGVLFPYMYPWTEDGIYFYLMKTVE